MAAREARTGSRRVWFDTRFVIGLVLVVASVAGTAFVVSTADSSVEVYSARNTLVPGDLITTDDLVVSHIGLESAQSRYLDARDLDENGVVVTRVIEAGELVPESATGSPTGVDLTALVITLASRIPEAISEGTTADLWAASKTDDGVYGAPVVAVPAATVVRVVDDEGIVVDDAAATVEVLVPHDNVARVLEAVANDDALSLIPSSLPLEE
jgi:hypothetical protein